MSEPVACPVCRKMIDIALVDKHLDTCTGTQVIDDEDDDPVIITSETTVPASKAERQGSTGNGNANTSSKQGNALSSLLSGNNSKRKFGVNGTKKRESTYKFQGFGSKNPNGNISGDYQNMNSSPDLKRYSSSLFVSEDADEEDYEEMANRATKKAKTETSSQLNSFGLNEISPVEPIKSERQLEQEEQTRRRAQELEEIRLLRIQSRLPLSERLRPDKLDDYVGQSHLVGKGGILRGFIENDRIPSMILWGPPGVGKTSLARIISHTTNCRFVELKATMSGVSECKRVFEEAKNELRLTKRKTVLFCDEIHRFNKAQQDIFLPYVEEGLITLIGATTENPSFQLNSALLSRCKVFVLKKLEVPELTKVITKALFLINKIRKLILNKPILRFSREAVEYVCDISDGDSRSALNLIDICDSHFMGNAEETEEKTQSKGLDISPEDLRKILQKTHMVYDRVGDAHYDTISAFHKSVRGNNADAALYYLARMLKGGESPLYIARRMIRIASEDIGLADDSCLPFATAAYQAVQFVGMPEADLALVHCAVKLCQAKKSIQIYRCWNELNAKLDHEPSVAGAPIPMHLRNAPTKLMAELGYSENYKYPPHFKDGKVKQEYFPAQLKGFKVLDGKDLGDMEDPDLE